MPDTSHWIYAPIGREPFEVTQTYLLDNWASYGPHTYLVPGRVWRDYQERARAFVVAKNEIREFHKATLTVVAS